MNKFKQELCAVINKHSKENDSDTPDFVLADYLVNCLDAYNKALGARKHFYGDNGDLHVETISESEWDKLQKYLPVEIELERAKAKHPAWPPNIFEQVAIMNEEAGEVTKAVLDYKREGGYLQDVKDELIQTAAMCMRMLGSLNHK